MITFNQNKDIYGIDPSVKITARQGIKDVQTSSFVIAFMASAPDHLKQAKSIAVGEKDGAIVFATKFPEQTEVVTMKNARGTSRKEAVYIISHTMEEYEVEQEIVKQFVNHLRGLTTGKFEVVLEGDLSVIPDTDNKAYKLIPSVITVGDETISL